MSCHRTRGKLGVLPSPLWGGVGGGGRCWWTHLAQQLRPPSPPLPHRKSGLPDLRKIIRDPGKPGARGGGSRPSPRRALWNTHGTGTITPLIFLVAITALIATPATAQPGLTKVRVAYDGFSMTSGPLIYADKQGIFKKFGLDIAPVFIDGGSMLTQAVVGGSVDIAQNGYTPALSAAVQGADVVIIGGISNKLPFQLVVKTAITRPDQLKGQSVAISRYGSSTDTAADFALAHLKLTRTDVKVLQLGGAATRIAAAMSGQIAGTMEQYPDTAELSRHGFHVMVDVTDIAGDYPNTSYVTSRSFLKSRPEVVKKFLMAMATAVHEYKANPSVAVPLSQKFLDVKDPENAKAAYDAYVKVYPDDLKASLPGVGLVLKEIAKREAKAAAMKPEQFVDTGILDALAREGFFKQLQAAN
jgi:NitT/TauT family transport system substrate-binding protein